MESRQKPRRLRSTDRSLPIALLRARETVMTPVRAMLAQSSLNEQKWRVLRVLDEGGPMEQTAIAQAACLLLPSLTRILQTMEADGLLTREPHPSDKRKTVVTIAPGGAALIARFGEESQAILDRLEREYGRERLELLLDLLEELQKLPMTGRKPL
jgi:homoprotocatechuate degradation regulator HpaR